MVSLSVGMPIPNQLRWRIGCQMNADQRDDLFSRMPSSRGWPESNGNGGRDQVGIPGRLAAEFRRLRSGAWGFSHLEITDNHGGEALDRGKPVAGKIRIGDRGYANAQAWQRLLQPREEQTASSSGCAGTPSAW
jgi:hypothetical protein